MSEERLDILDAVWRAFNSPFGCVIRADPQRIRPAFYAARATDPELACLGIYNSPFSVDEFFIVKREVLDAYRKARKENPPVSGGGLGEADQSLSTDGSDDLSLDP